MAEPTRLASPRLEVLLEGQEAPLTVQATNADMVRFDLERAKAKWPSMEDAPILWLTYVAWSALKRTSALDMPWAVFAVQCEQVRDLSQVEGSDDAARPTHAGAEPG